MSCVEDSLVKTSLLLEKERVSMVKSLVFGGRCTESFASYDLESSSWRTSQMLLTGDCLRFSGRWPQSGMVQSGVSYQLHNLVLPTSERDGFVLPTPTTNDHKNNPHTPSQWLRHDSLNIEAAKLQGFTKETIGRDSQLNPLFVIEMMGFPIDWLS